MSRLYEVEFVSAFTAADLQARCLMNHWNQSNLRSSKIKIGLVRLLGQNDRRQHSESSKNSKCTFLKQLLFGTMHLIANLAWITMKRIVSCVAVSWPRTCFCSQSNGRHLPVERKIEVDWLVFLFIDSFVMHRLTGTSTPPSPPPPHCPRLV